MTLPSKQYSLGFTLIEVMVALSVLALAVVGLAKVQGSALSNLGITTQMQYASYLADSHLNSLHYSEGVKPGIQRGVYAGQTADINFPWALSIIHVPQNSLEPKSPSLSNKVRPLSIDLIVWIDDGRRELRFHTLIFAKHKHASEM